MSIMFHNPERFKPIYDAILLLRPTIHPKGLKAERIVKQDEYIFVRLANGLWWWSGEKRWKLDKFAYPDCKSHWHWQTSVAYGLAKLGFFPMQLALDYAGAWSDLSMKDLRASELKDLNRLAKKLGYTVKPIGAS